MSDAKIDGSLYYTALQLVVMPRSGKYDFITRANDYRIRRDERAIDAALNCPILVRAPDVPSTSWPQTEEGFADSLRIDKQDYTAALAAKDGGLTWTRQELLRYDQLDTTKLDRWFLLDADVYNVRNEAKIFFELEDFAAHLNRHALLTPGSNTFSSKLGSILERASDRVRTQIPEPIPTFCLVNLHGWAMFCESAGIDVFPRLPEGLYGTYAVHHRCRHCEAVYPYTVPADTCPLKPGKCELLLTC
jgi:hypothetical protein